MKKLLLAALSCVPLFAFAAGNDLFQDQRNPANTATQTRTVTVPNADAIQGFAFTPAVPGNRVPVMFTLGSGLSLTGTVLSATGSPSSPPTWSAILDKPTSVAGYAISDAATTGALSAGLASKFNTPTGSVSQYLRGDGSAAAFPALFSGAYGDLSGIPATFAPAAHNQAWSTITATPTTLGGYGITDGLTAGALTPYALTSSVTAGLAGKFNSPTGTATQYLRGDGSLATFPSIPAAQVQSDWNAVSAPAAILNKPTTFAPAAHTQAWSTITATPTTVSGYGLTDAATTTQLAAKFNTPAGTTLQYVRGDGSLATLPVARRIETYSGTTNASGQITVTYPTAFAAVPVVQPPAPALANQAWTTISSTATGFTLQLNQRNSINLLSTDLLLGNTVPVAGATALVLVVAQ